MGDGVAYLSFSPGLKQAFNNLAQLLNATNNDDSQQALSICLTIHICKVLKSHNLQGVGSGSPRAMAVAEEVAEDLISTAGERYC